MPSPLQTLRRGILEGDWNVVVSGFNKLVGEKLPVPKGGGDEAERVLKQIYDLLEGRRDADADPEKGEPEPEEEADEGEGEADDEPESETKPPPRAPPRESPADFSIEHADGRPDEEGEKGRRCRTLPMDTTPQKSRWKDTGKLSIDMADESRKMSEKFAGKEYRSSYSTVKVTCGSCNKSFRVDPANAPKRCDSADQVSKYVCDTCIGRQVRK